MKNIVLILSILISINGSAQTDTSQLHRNILSSMDGMQTSFMKSDWEVFVNYMHPEIIKLSGGKEKLTTLVKGQMNALNNATIDTIGSGNVLQLINFNGQWQCVVESFLQMTIESKTVTVISSNIGVSDDGKSWKFIRVATGKEGTMVKMFSSLSSELKPPLNKTLLTTAIEAFKNYTPIYPERTSD